VEGAVRARADVAPAHYPVQVLDLGFGCIVWRQAPKPPVHYLFYQLGLASSCVGFNNTKEKSMLMRDQRLGYPGTSSLLTQR